MTRNLYDQNPYSELVEGIVGRFTGDDPDLYRTRVRRVITLVAQELVTAIGAIVTNNESLDLEGAFCTLDLPAILRRVKTENSGFDRREREILGSKRTSSLSTEIVAGLEYHPLALLFLYTTIFGDPEFRHDGTPVSPDWEPPSFFEWEEVIKKGPSKRLKLLGLEEILPVLDRPPGINMTPPNPGKGLISRQWETRRRAGLVRGKKQ